MKKQINIDQQIYRSMRALLLIQGNTISNWVQIKMTEYLDEHRDCEGRLPFDRAYPENSHCCEDHCDVFKIPKPYQHNGLEE